MLIVVQRAATNVSTFPTLSVGVLLKQQNRLTLYMFFNMLPLFQAFVESANPTMFPIRESLVFRPARVRTPHGNPLLLEHV